MRGMHLLFFSAWVFLAGATIECGNNGESCDGGSCADASTVPPVSGGGCDSSKPASQGGCAVADSDGFFVSPTGNDGNAGSKTAPFQTIAKGISAAAGSPAKPNVYVCQGTYAENLVIEKAPAGVALHGGFDCTSWAQTSAPTTVAPAYKAGAYVLSVAGAAALVESMTLSAPDATDPGASSIAALVNGSPGMTFRRAAVTAGAGANGATPPQLPADAANTAGISNSNGNTCPSVKCSCTSDTTTGGNGGGYYDGGTGFTNPSPGLPVIPSDPDAGGTGNPGGNGANGVDGKAGTSTGTLGELTATGWIPSPGGAGAVGGTAQGGGGGFGDPGVPTAGGGGGACGGCGGKGGLGGGGGGASIAIAALNSTLRIQGSTIHGGKAGSGANGGLGQPGQPGGSGGTSFSGNGGSGGTGGAGGTGGGGAGGISVAIATAGTTPDIDTFSTVLAGTAGQGGTGGSGTKAIDGVATPIQGF